MTISLIIIVGRAGSRARCIPIYVSSQMFENVAAKITAI